MTAAAFKATYADWKVVKTRGVVQVVLEVPLSDEGAAYKALGGMPNPAEERWFGIARLNPEQKGEAEQSVSEVSRPSPPAGGAHKSWDELSRTQRAGILCADPVFHAFLREARGRRDVKGEHGAAEYVRTYCGVDSRKFLDGDADSARIFDAMTDNFRAWRAKEAA